MTLDPEQLQKNYIFLKAVAVALCLVTTMLFQGLGSLIVHAQDSGIDSGASGNENTSVVYYVDGEGSGDEDDNHDDNDNGVEDAVVETEQTVVTEASGTNTGDDSNILLWIILLASAMGASLYLLLKSKKVK